jgi:polyisoprenoid-binding protein YceI
MQTHFQENYMESAKYPNGSFKGTVVSPENFKISNKEQAVIVKGTFNIHGIEKEMEVKGTLHNTKEGLKLNANFQILLSDYQIGVPSNLVTKIAQNIDVKVNAILNAK